VELDRLVTDAAAAAIRTQEQLNTAAARECDVFARLAAAWPSEWLDVVRPIGPRHHVLARHEFECGFAVTRVDALGASLSLRLLNTSFAVTHSRRIERQCRVRLTVVQTNQPEVANGR
jgi:hypothetical protein